MSGITIPKVVKEKVKYSDANLFKLESCPICFKMVG
jgi:hypothetical protein